MSNKPKIKTKQKNNNNKTKNALWKRRRKEIENTTTLSEKKEEASNVSEQRDRLDTRNPCTRYNPLSSDNNIAGQQTLTRLPPSRVHRCTVWAMPVSCLVVTLRESRDQKRDFQLQTTQTLEASCLFSFKSILLCTSGKCQSIKRTACMLNFIYIVQSKWYLRLKISVQGPFNAGVMLVVTV